MHIKHQIEHEETIVAPLTGIGGAVSIIRLSGNQSLEIAKKIWQPVFSAPALQPRHLTLGKIKDNEGQALDHCLLAYMPGPNSYTGEDCLEFHCHGGPMVTQLVLQQILKYGARMAEPGEFTRRAFLNGRLDLTQAEAVLDIIQARGKSALHAANRQLAGGLGKRIESLYLNLSELLSEIEVQLDFADEDLDFMPKSSINANLNELLSEITALLRTRRQGEILRQGLPMVIAGPPNAGKSSLLNLLLGHDRAIVTEIPGTTRDTLDAFIQLQGIPIRITDTAGIRPTRDPIEKQGVARSLKALNDAAVILWVRDITQPQTTEKPPENSACTVIQIANKADLLPPGQSAPPGEIRFSTKTEEGLATLYQTLEQIIWKQLPPGESTITINQRHAELLERCHNILSAEITQNTHLGLETLSVSIQSALDALGRILGKTANADILDQIFSRFCIGK